MERMERVI
jgi:hypothetical protein